jgi:hypothetical protein
MAWRAKCRVSGSLFSTALRWRYSDSSFHQLGSELDDSVTVATTDLDSQDWPARLGGVPESVSEVGAGLPPSGGVPGACAGSSSSSGMDGLMTSCMNTPGGGYPQLDLS